MSSSLVVFLLIFLLISLVMLDFFGVVFLVGYIFLHMQIANFFDLSDPDRSEVCRAECIMHLLLGLLFVFPKI